VPTNHAYIQVDDEKGIRKKKPARMFRRTWVPTIGKISAMESDLAIKLVCYPLFSSGTDVFVRKVWRNYDIDVVTKAGSRPGSFFFPRGKNHSASFINYQRHLYRLSTKVKQI
jgi:hypothetical protein